MAPATVKPRPARASGRTVAVVGGAALLLWLLLRDGSPSLGGRDGEASGAGRPDPCRVRVDAAGIQLDGERADLPTTVDRCRATGAAEVSATGAAIVGVVVQLVRALQAEGVAVLASAAIWRLVDASPGRQP